MSSKLKRTLSADTIHKTDQEVLLRGWVERIRGHGKLIFFDLRDRKGLVQVVVNAEGSEKAFAEAEKIHPEFAVELLGKVNKRPQGAVNKNIATGEVEIEAKDIEILSSADTLPFDTTKQDLNLELPTLLDYRSLSLRHSKQQMIFKVQEAVVDSFREAAKKLDCTEIFIPTIVYIIVY